MSPDRVEPVEVSALPSRRAGEAVEVLSDAFGSYPVMEYVVPSGPEHPTHLRALVEFFVMARFLRGGLVLGASTPSGALAGVATVTIPEEKASPAALLTIRDSVWRMLGHEARRRYEAFSEACSVFTVERPHYHLNMIGVRAALAGRGVGRVLLEAVHRASAADEGSCGVTLTTEDPGNVALYQRFGYEVLGHVQVGDGLESWGLFREDD